MLKQNTRKVYCRQFSFIQSWSQQCSTVLQYHFKQKAMYTMYCFNCPSSLSAIMVFFQFRHRHRTQVHDKPCMCILHLFKLYYAQYSQCFSHISFPCCCLHPSECLPPILSCVNYVLYSQNASVCRCLCTHAYAYICTQNSLYRLKVQELCESRGGRPGLSVLLSLLVSVDVKIY